MEEADVLGDRIAIMAQGKIQCCGTPIFLKKFYGTGYLLKMTVQPDVKSENILETIKKHVAGAAWKTQQFEHPTNLIITLPNEPESVANFSAMFREITQNKEALGIITIGMSLTSMDDVFSKVDELNREEIERHKPKEMSSTKIVARNFSEPLARTKVSHYFLKLWALLIKRFIYTYRKWKLLICQLVFPLFVFILTLMIVNGEIPTLEKPPELTNINLKEYEKPMTLYSFTDQAREVGQSYAELVGPSREILNSDLLNELVDVGNKDNSHTDHFIVAANFAENDYTAFYSAFHSQAAPLSINLISNAYLKSIPAGKAHSIRMSVHPLNNLLNDAEKILEHVAKPKSFKSIYSLYGIFLPASLAIVTATFVVFPIEERISKVTQLQLMTGVSPFIYWGSTFLWDMTLMTILAAVMTSCVHIFEIYNTYTMFGGSGVIFLCVVLYAWAAIPFAYLFSLIAKSVPGGFALVTTIHILTGSIWPMATQVLLYYEETTYISEYSRHFGRPFPTFGLSFCFMDFAATAVHNSRCNIIPERIKEIICSQSNFYEKQRLCCQDCATTRQCKPDSYVSWTSTFDRGFGVREIADLGQEVLVLFIIGCFYTFLLYVIAYGVFRKLKKSPNQTFQLNSKDEDVVEENERVQEMIRSRTMTQDALVVAGLCKGFGSFAAVSNLSFGVHSGECFGLLGVNGAGKTTTFRILTGDEKRSSGNAFILEHNLDKNRQNFLASIGYCPQFDPIIGVLTGREMVELFGRLRNIPSKKVGREADKWLSKLGLYEAGNVQCQKYSGGMKRRLSCAMAMIGNPEIILLDEPTSGVDPVARRQFWRVIAGLRDSGQSIILTSHSMDECEALCTRIGIMVNGQFQCFGGVLHLKNKFAQGFSLILKLKPHVVSTSDEAHHLKLKISQIFEPCLLKDEHQNVLHYQLINTSMEWNVLFEALENLKIEMEGLIEDFSVSETTLEDVFLSFAKQQHTHRKTGVTRWKKYICCCCK